MALNHEWCPACRKEVNIYTWTRTYKDLVYSLDYSQQYERVSLVKYTQCNKCGKLLKGEKIK